MGQRPFFGVRGVKASAKAPHDFSVPKTLKLKKKSGGPLRPVIFGSERLPNWNFCVFINAPADKLGFNFSRFKLMEYYKLIHHFKALFMKNSQKNALVGFSNCVYRIIT